MRKLAGLLLALVLISGCFGGGKKAKKMINGAGATFPYPVYVEWAREYEKATGIRVNYQGIGSGGGIKQVSERVVDFGGSDTMLSPEELGRKGLLQFPAIIGSIVVVHNVEGIKDGELKLSNEAVCKIFLGKVKYWDDDIIKKDNPGVKLPHQAITVVHRAEGSGTTWNFTYWLSSVCKEWKDEVGYGKVVSWKTGIGAKGNAGVTNYVMKTPGAIGYVEYAYKVQNNLKAVQLQTKEGKFIAPTFESFARSAETADWSPENHFYIEGNLILKPNSWPLTASSVILLPKEKYGRNKMVVDFFKWAFENGDRIAKKLGYVPLPEKAKKMVENYWKEHIITSAVPQSR